MGAPGTDTVTRFLIPAATARGGVVRLEATYAEVLSRHRYPPRLSILLGELLAATALLATSLKFRGSLIVQLSGRAALKLLVVECDDELQMRAMAQWHGEIDADADLARLTAGDTTARLVITLDPRDGGQVYQGIVAVEAGSIATLIEHYLASSEQLESRLWLAADGTRAGGLLLQRLPASGASDDEQWNTAEATGATVRAGELLSLPVGTLLNRLWHEFEVRVFAARDARFHCPCTEERVAGALRLLGRAEVDSILAEQGSVAVTCEFCNREYRFDPTTIQRIFGSPTGVPENITRH